MKSVVFRLFFGIQEVLRTLFKSMIYFFIVGSYHAIQYEPDLFN